MSTCAPITLNTATRRFELHTEGHLAWLEFAPVEGGLAFTHTIVPKELGGRGIGGRLVQHALDWAAQQGQAVRPDCSFVDAWLRKHPQHPVRRLG